MIKSNTAVISSIGISKGQLNNPRVDLFPLVGIINKQKLNRGHYETMLLTLCVTHKPEIREFENTNFCCKKVVSIPQMSVTLAFSCLTWLIAVSEGGQGGASFSPPTLSATGTPITMKWVGEMVLCSQPKFYTLKISNFLGIILGSDI